MTKGIQAICDKLAHEPVFQMSLNSKELFHSNMLAWFCESYPDLAREVFSQWVPSRETTRHQIKREKNNLDVVIELPGLAPVVIENKVFSPPDEEQLNRYSQKKIVEQLENPTLILLSLENPKWEGNSMTSPSGLSWRYVSYRDLSGALSGAVKEIPGFGGDLIRHYVDVINLLQEALDEISVLNGAEQVFLASSTREILESIRMADAFGKLRARWSIAEISKMMKPLIGTSQIKFAANFTNGEPLIEAHILSKNGDGIGWQYQANQWRLAVWSGSYVGVGDELRKEREDYVAEHYKTWFDFDPIQTLIGRKSSKISKKELEGGFLCYAPNFVYRKRDLQDLTVSELEKLSLHYLTQAINLIDK
jgi:hypothetical protein